MNRMVSVNLTDDVTLIWEDVNNHVFRDGYLFVFDMDDVMIGVVNMRHVRYVKATQK